MSELTWRKETPDKPGWWLAWTGDGEIVAYDVHFSPPSDRTILFGTSEADAGQVLKMNHLLWSGPIEPPRREG